MKKIFRSSHFSGLVYGVLLLALIHIVGTLGYKHLGGESATWIDSFYMTFITVATIGYGEIIDLTHHPYGRLFTVGISVVGIGAMSYMFSTFVALLLESDLNVALKRKRMEKNIAQIRGHYLVCGIGRVGSNVASELLTTRRELVAIETDQVVLDRWLSDHPTGLHLQGDAADDDVLRKAGVMYASGVFAVTGDDSHNLMIALSVKLLNPKARVVVRLHDIRNAAKARKAGADEIVSPDFTGGMRIASAMLRPHVVNFMDRMLHTDEGLRVEEVSVPPQLPPTPIGQLVPRSQDYILMAIHEHGKWTFHPPENHLIKGGTVLVLMVNPGGRVHLEHLLRHAVENV